jgi:hypothetical protein
MRGHVSQQTGLSAIVSVPSWWKTSELEVSRCWVDPALLPVGNGDVADLCRSPVATGGLGTLFPTDGEQPRPFDIKLPGDYYKDEVSRKLGFQVLKQPSIKKDGPPLQIDTGPYRKLLIRGERLWRSTRVSIDNQVAEEIEVLPDMRGIIASFDCLQLPPGPAAGPGSAAESDPQNVCLPDSVPRMGQPQSGQAMLRVWTSEGTDEMPVTVNNKSDYCEGMNVKRYEQNRATTLGIGR